MDYHINMEQLQRDQIKRIKQVLNGKPVTILKTSMEKHQLLLHWNFDDGLEPFKYLVNQPDTDLGTIVLLYWLLEPGYYYKNNKDNETSLLIKKIEENVKNDFYKSKEISVDPKNNLGTNFLDEPNNRDTLKLIPEIFAQPTLGKEVGLLKLIPQVIDKVYPLNQVDRIKLNNQIEKGILELIKINPNISQDSKPEEIIDALNLYAKSKRPKEEGLVIKFDRKQNLLFKCLDLVFGEQLVRKADWKWYIHELHEQVLDYRDFVLISADNKFEWHPFGGMLKYFSERIYREYVTLNNSFDELLNLNRYRETKIKEKFDQYRNDHSEFSGKSNEEIFKTLLKQKIDRLRTVPYYIEKYANVSDKEIIEKNRSYFNWEILGQVLPSDVIDFSDRNIELESETDKIN